ncbi:MAG: hypothetical protein R3254_08305 [Thiomicrorhabdus sp.]|nr:hypothetical protein [Thiomicrorhabdus sp.]
MSKKLAVSHIRSAKASHIEWRSDVQGYVAGTHIDERKLPLIHTESVFARWYYTEGQKFSHLQSYKPINLLLEEVFEKYRNLYRVLHTPAVKSHFFQSQNKIEAQRKAKINTLQQELFNSSQKLIQATNVLEQEIIQMSDEAFAKLI